MKKVLEKAAVLSLSLILISAFSVSAALPAMLETFKEYSQEQVEMLISVPSFSITAMLLASPWLSRYIKERKIIVGGLLLLSASGMVPVFFQQYSIILGARILLGLGIGMVSAKAVSIISERYQGEEKTALLGYRGAAEGLGNAVMTLAAGQLSAVRWNYAFLVYSLGFLISFLYLVFVPEKITWKNPEHRSAGKNFSIKGCAGITGFYAAAAGLLTCVNSGCSLRIPLLVLERGFGTETEASILLSSMMVAGIFAGICFGWMAHIFDGRLPAFSFLLTGAGLAVMVFSGNLFLLGTGALITGFFYTLSLTCVFNGLSERLPDETVHGATSAVLACCNLCAACSPIILKGLQRLDSKTGTPLLVYACGAVLIGGMILLKERSWKSV